MKSDSFWMVIILVQLLDQYPMETLQTMCYVPILKWLYNVFSDGFRNLHFQVPPFASKTNI